MNDRNYDRVYYRRPILLSIFSIFHILAGIGVVILGASAIALGTLPEVMDSILEVSVIVMGAILVVAGLILAGIGIALFSGKTWGWWFATVMTVVMLAFNIYSFEILPIIFSLIVLLYLTSKNTRGWFKNRSERV